MENALSLKFRLVLGVTSDIMTVRRIAKSQPRWDIGDCSQHTSQVGWRMADHHFVHQEAQFVVDPLLDRQPVQFLERKRYTEVD